jgi:hypothetical protein
MVLPHGLWSRGRGRAIEAVVRACVPVWLMVIMAGMLPGVECARRRRLWQGGAAAEASGRTRRSSFCLYVAGHGWHPAGAGDPAKVVRYLLVCWDFIPLMFVCVLHVWMIRRPWVFVCMQQRRSGVMETIDGWTLDSNVRAAKERLDQKLRHKRDAVIKRYKMIPSFDDLMPHSTGSIVRARGIGGKGSSSTSSLLAVQREVYSKKGVMRRLMRWVRPRCDAAEQNECAVCLDYFRTGDILAHLPCGHRFHWACVLPWLEVMPRCPSCRASVEVGGNINPNGHKAAA